MFRIVILKKILQKNKEEKYSFIHVLYHTHDYVIYRFLSLKEKFIS